MTLIADSLPAARGKQGDRPAVLLLQPQEQRQVCFTARQLEDLRTEYRLIEPDLHTPDQLADAWPELAAGCEAVVTGWGSPPITDRMLGVAPSLGGWVHAAGTVKHLLPPTVWERGIRVATANEALGIAVAETTVGLIIAGLKGFFPCAELTRDGGWKLEEAGIEVRELYDVTIGVIGASQVGRHLMRLLRQFEVRILLYDPFVTESEARDLGARLVDLRELCSRSDVVSLCAPALPSTRKMMGAPQFGAMKTGGIFINTARGMLVDETALAEELQRGRIWAFLDVTFPEPPRPDHPFRKLPNVVLLPHIAGTVTNGRYRLGRSAARQLRQFFDGAPMTGELNQQMLARIA